MVEQVIRPTGLLDPKVVVRPVDGQIDDSHWRNHARTAKGETVLVTTAHQENGRGFDRLLETAGIKVRYMHHDVKTIERQELVRDLRLGVYDVLVGINLLREGLDIPEVSLVAILDADKEAFSGRRPRSSRPSAAPHETSTAWSCCMQTASRPR